MRDGPSRWSPSTQPPGGGRSASSSGRAASWPARSTFLPRCCSRVKRPPTWLLSPSRSATSKHSRVTDGPDQRGVVMPGGAVFHEFKGWTYRLAVEQTPDGRNHRAALEFWPPGQSPQSYTGLTLLGPLCPTEDDARAAGMASAEGWIN